MIRARRHTNADSARERVMAMMSDLDVVLLRLPDDPPDDMIEDIERVVLTLRTADECLTEGHSRSGMQSLELARARLIRLAERLVPPQDPEGPKE